MNHDPHVLRILDANANRAREALRVMEDYARFGLNDQALSKSLKILRHGLAESLQVLDAGDSILHRATECDVGRSNKTAAEAARANLGEIVVAAGKRLSEALRALEECAKTIDPAVAARIEAMRYEGYIHEQMLARAAGQAGRFACAGVYVLLTEGLCKMSWEATLRAVLRGGACCVQLREKSLPDAELLRRAVIVVEGCRRHGAVSIINDRADIARLANADGVHLGQDDLDCAAVRRLVGRDMVIGVSTENLNQAQTAVRAGASYVGVGPMFATATKEKPRIAGPAYAAEAVKELPIPCVAIGGIHTGNIGEVRSAGVSCVAVCSAVIGAADPESATRALVAVMQER